MAASIGAGKLNEVTITPEVAKAMSLCITAFVGIAVDRESPRANLLCELAVQALGEIEVEFGSSWWEATDELAKIGGL